MHNLILRKIDLSDQWQPLAPARLVGSVVISAPPANAQPVMLLADDGSELPFVPGEWHWFLRVDLASIQVKGTDGDTVTVVGGSW